MEIRFDNESPIPVEFDFEMTTQDYSDIRWYLEDFLKYPMEPNPERAQRIEARMHTIGIDLFKNIFGSFDTIELWGRLKTIGLSNIRVEITTTLRDAVAIPWESLCHPNTNTPLALEALSFVRVPVNPARLPKVLNPTTGKVRILLVICRPGGGDDVPFRSVAGKLLKGLNEQAREQFELTVLRPPTFESLANILRQAKAEGRPYHIVHFDGHGVYLKTKDAKVAAGVLRGQMPLAMTSMADGANGYLLFENAQNEHNIELRDGTTLGKLLYETDVPILVLNACRSAHADIQRQPEDGTDSHETVRAYGSLAQEVIDAGVAGVVAMGYNVYVVTAAKFVAELYGALAQGAALGEAVTRGRKHLAENPSRAIAFDPLPLQDWSVPVVYENTPLHLFQNNALTGIRFDLENTAFHGDGLNLPPEPDAGFFGRDETILAIDRAFDQDSLVLLCAYAGEGKTTTAAEFARWYGATGGVPAGAKHLLFTSFERYKPLTQVLDTIGQAFGKILEHKKILWLTLDDRQRKDIALQVLQQYPVVWVWDNVETVAGFPTGSESMWSQDEQNELINFLRVARSTKAKFLLTSRRDEQFWLGNLPTRIVLPAMQILERFQLTGALAKKRRRRVTDVEDWKPLLKFTQGNPLTITVLVGQALHDGLKHRWQIEDFVEKLRKGEAKFDDEASEGRSRSLGASLDYGFQYSFSQDERKVLALLHFFQGFVDVQALRIMVNPQNADWGLGPKDFTDESGIALLDRVAEIGLLTAYGSGHYSIHPALPWYFRSLFEQYYSEEPKIDNKQLSEDQSRTYNRQIAATRAFVEAIGMLGNYYHDEYGGGNRAVIFSLHFEEANLLFARSLACQYGWWDVVIRTMQGLLVLYDPRGRNSEWKRLVDEIVLDFVDAETGAPLPGREKNWSIVTQYRVHLAGEALQLAQAENLQRIELEWNRSLVEPLLVLPPQELSGDQLNSIRSLAVSLERLGSILREQEKSECVDFYHKAISLCQRIGDTAEEAVIFYNLGHTYMEIPALRNIDEAERFYLHSLELRAVGDFVGRSCCYNQLSVVECQRFDDALKEEQIDEVLFTHLINAALMYCQKALDLLPPYAVSDLGINHHQMAMIYMKAGNQELAMSHYYDALRYHKLSGDFLRGAATCYQIAQALTLFWQFNQLQGMPSESAQLEDALSYARAALRDLQQFGEAMRTEQDETEALIREIDGLKDK